MVDIQSAAAESRRGIKKEERRRRKKPQGKNVMTCPIPQGGHNKPCGCKQSVMKNIIY